MLAYYALQGGRKQGQIKNRAKFDSVKSPNHKKKCHIWGFYIGFFSAYLEILLYLRMKNNEDEKANRKRAGNKGTWQMYGELSEE